MVSNSSDAPLVKARDSLVVERLRHACLWMKHLLLLGSCSVISDKAIVPGQVLSSEKHLNLFELVFVEQLDVLLSCTEGAHCEASSDCLQVFIRRRGILKDVREVKDSSLLEQSGHVVDQRVSVRRVEETLVSENQVEFALH